MSQVVGVITTCFNQADLVGECIESVQQQKTDATIHHVVCDDGSEDNSFRCSADTRRNCRTFVFCR
jgi:glycosyltransferase involved in cell wall biosynthesis